MNERVVNPDGGSLPARRYLLGEASEEECAAIEREYLGSEATVDEIAAAEEHLIEDYLADRLTPDERRHFDRHYLTSPYHRRRVEMIRRLSATDDRSGIHPDTHSHVAIEAPRRWYRRPSSHWLALAATVLAAAGYLIADDLRLRHQVSQSQAARAELESRERQLQTTLNEQRAADGKTMQELERVQALLAQLEDRTAADHQRTRPVVASFVLWPALRGAGDVQTVALPRASGEVRMQLELESDRYRGYTVALKDPATDRILWRSGDRKSITTGGTKSLSITIGTSLLRSQKTYSLEVTGVSARGPAEFVADYTFRIVGNSRPSLAR